MADLARLTQRQLAVVAGSGAVLGVLLVGLAVRGCRASRNQDLEPRVARIEDLLGLVDAAPLGASPGPLGDAAPLPPVSADDRAAPCALARVAAYRAWQEAIAKAKTNAGPAQAACADEWSDRKKQACYYAAMATIRTSQAARDALMMGGSAAREAVNGVKDDPKNDALARAHAASDAVFQACDDDGG
jgi:hypothetical protein